MPRTITRSAATLVTSCALAGVAVVGALAAGTSPGAAAPATSLTGSNSKSANTAPSRTVADTPYDFIDLPRRAISADGKAHEFTLRHRNTAGSTRTVAFQVLVVSPEHGPFLRTSDVRLEALNPRTHHWAAAPLGSQTGTLYTTIPASGHRLAPASELSARYRLTFTHAEANAPRHAQLQPRVVVYRHAAAAAS
jgi:hypothetical protein